VSVLYGSDAMTGVVQIFTRTGQGAAQVGAELRAGTYASTEGALDVVGGTKTIAYSARVSQFRSDGLYPYNNEYRNSVVSARIRVAPDARSDASLTYRYGDDIYHFPTNGQGAPVDSNQRAAERGPLLSLSAGRFIGDHVEARLGAAAREARLFFNDEPDSPGEDGTFWSKDWIRRATANALLTWRAHGVSATVGVEYEDQRQRGASEFSASFGTFPNPSVDVRRTNTGYFAQAVITAGPSAITVGGRFDDNSQFGTHATYRAGVVYGLREGIRLRASAGTGFKEPTFFENFATGFVVGNPGLDPERSSSWEVGVERGAVAVTYFNQRFRGLIEYDPAPALGDPNYFNVGGAIADGIEANASASIATRATLAVSYTYLHTRVEQSGSSDPNGSFAPGKPLLRRPTHTVAPRLAATLSERSHVMLEARWVGKRDDVGPQRVTLRPYTRVNLSGDYAIGRVMASARLENVFNDQAQEINGFRPRGRTVMVGGRITVGGGR
jgi:vitamin B12 transporter